MKAKVYGIKRMIGTSKQGKPLDADILHVAFLEPANSKNFEGSMVKEIWVNRDSGIMPEIPAIGSTVEIGFTFTGYPEYVEIL